MLDAHHCQSCSTLPRSLQTSRTGSHDGGHERRPAHVALPLRWKSALLALLVAPSLHAQTPQKQNIVVKVVVSLIRTVAPVVRPSAPTFAPSSGSYLPGQQIALADDTPGAIIHYTLNGSPPSFSSPVYTAPLVLSANATIQAVAVVGSASSAASTATYTVTPPRLVFSNQPQPTQSNVTLFPAPSVTILDGSGNLLTGATNAITLSLASNPGNARLSGTTTVSAIHGVATFSNLSVTRAGSGYAIAASSPGVTPSTSQSFNVSSPSITISLPSLSTVVGSSVTGTITLGQPAGAAGVSVSLAGSSPNMATVSPSRVAIAAGQSTGHFQLSCLAVGAYTLSAASPGFTSDTIPVTSLPPAPAITPPSGTYAQGQQVTLSDTLPSAVLHYTTDGSVPSAGSQPYAGPFSLTKGQTVRAIAVQSSLSSSVSSEIYQLLTVAMSLSPATVTLGPSQTQGFVASLTGLTDTGVSWSVNPSMGTISSSGLYTAPASIVSAQTVTIVATSRADATRTATASVSLVPPVNVLLAPAIATLSPAQTQSFAATVTGTSNTAVLYSLSPVVGTVSAAGLYTAPTTINTAQTVTLLATSAADPTKSATAKIALVPPVAVTLTPASVALASSQTQTFAATVTGSSNPAVSYTLTPAVGTISASGVYTPPASVLATQMIRVTATSVADTTKSATAAITLVAAPTITLSLSGSAVAVGGTQPGTITLSQPAGSGGVAVTIASAAPDVATPNPLSLTIASGQTSGSFTYTGLAAGSTVFTAAAIGYTSATAQVTVAPPSIPGSLFGLTVLNFQNITPGVQFGTTRSWDAYYFAGLDWADINTAPGVYDFFSLDQFIKLNQSRGADILYTFGRTPQWASSQPNAAGAYGPGQCAPPANMAAWDDFVTALVTHAAGRIKYWELWNEPNSTPMYCGDIPTMVTMAKHASAIIKKIDPTALLLSPGVTGGPGPGWLSTFLAGGGASAVDVIGFHGYWSGNAEDVVNVISTYKAAMQANGSAAKPMWDTEASWGGFGNLGTPSTPQQVGFVAKYYLLHWSQGVSRFIWFAFDAESTPWGDLWSSTVGATPAAAAYGETYKWMVGASLKAPCSKAASGVWTCDLTRSGGYQAQAVWISNSSATYTVPSQYKQYRDLADVVHPITGGKITAGDQPVLLESQNLP